MDNSKEHQTQNFDGRIFLTKKEINRLVMGIDMGIRNECETHSRALYDGDKIETVLKPYFDLRKKLATYYEQING